MFYSVQSTGAQVSQKKESDCYYKASLQSVDHDAKKVQLIRNRNSTKAENKTIYVGCWAKDARNQDSREQLMIEQNNSVQLRNAGD